MVTKAIIEEIIDEYHIKVRIPFYDSVVSAKDHTAAEDLSIATICDIPNTHNTYHLNDIVYIAFEDNDIGRPVILGVLKKEQDLPPINKLEDFNIRILNTYSTTTLSQDTYIGEIKPSEIVQLGGLTGNIQQQLDDLNRRITILENTNNN